MGRTFAILVLCGGCTNGVTMLEAIDVSDAAAPGRPDLSLGPDVGPRLDLGGFDLGVEPDPGVTALDLDKLPFVIRLTEDGNRFIWAQTQMLTRRRTIRGIDLRTGDRRTLTERASTYQRHEGPHAAGEWVTSRGEHLLVQIQDASPPELGPGPLHLIGWDSGRTDVLTSSTVHTSYTLNAEGTHAYFASADGHFRIRELASGQTWTSEEGAYISPYGSVLGFKVGRDALYYPFETQGGSPYRFGIKRVDLRTFEESTVARDVIPQSIHLTERGLTWHRQAGDAYHFVRLSSGEEVVSARGRDFNFDAEGRWIVFLTDDGSLYAQDLELGTAPHLLFAAAPRRVAYRSLRWRDDGRLLIVRAADGNNLDFWVFNPLDASLVNVTSTRSGGEAVVVEASDRLVVLSEPCASSSPPEVRIFQWSSLREASVPADAPFCEWLWSSPDGSVLLFRGRHSSDDLETPLYAWSPFTPDRVERLADGASDILAEQSDGWRVLIGLGRSHSPSGGLLFDARTQTYQTYQSPGWKLKLAALVETRMALVQYAHVESEDRYRVEFVSFD